MRHAAERVRPSERGPGRESARVTYIRRAGQCHPGGSGGLAGFGGQYYVVFLRRAGDVRVGRVREALVPLWHVYMRDRTHAVELV